MNEGQNRFPTVSVTLISCLAVVSVTAISFLAQRPHVAIAGYVIVIAAATYLIAASGRASRLPMTLAFLAFPATVAVTAALALPGTSVDLPIPDTRGSPSGSPDGGPAVESGQSDMSPETAIKLEMLDAEIALAVYDREKAVAILSQVLERIDRVLPENMDLRSVAVGRMLALRSRDEDRLPSLELVDEHVNKLKGARGIGADMKIEWLDRAGRLAGDIGQLERSMTYLKEARAVLGSADTPDPGRMAIMDLNIAVTLDRLGRKDEAIALLSKIEATMGTRLPDDHPARVQARRMKAALEREGERGAPEENQSF